MSKFYYDHEIVELLLTEDNILTKKDKDKIKNTEESCLKDLNDEFGKTIRNEFSLYHMQNPNTFSYEGKMLFSPSEISFKIINELWIKLQD